jgi:hypothetical protein
MKMTSLNDDLSVVEVALGRGSGVEGIGLALLGSLMKRILML